jgi:hypothetical protein
MAEPADQALLQGLAALGAALEEVGAPAMVIGGIGVIARGVPRQTIDVDATVWADAVETSTLLTLLARHEIRPRIADAADFAQRHQVLLLRHDPSGTPMEISFASLPFEREALPRHDGRLRRRPDPGCDAGRPRGVQGRRVAGEGLGELADQGPDPGQVHGVTMQRDQSLDVARPVWRSILRG